MEIVELLERDISAGNEELQRLPLDFLHDEDGLNLRDYQIEAIQSVERAVVDGRENIYSATKISAKKRVCKLRPFKAWSRLHSRP